MTGLGATAVPLLLVAARLGGLALFAPVFGSPVIVGRVKILFFIGMAAAAMPVLGASGTLAGTESLGLWALLASLAIEIVVGALIGFIALYMVYGRAKKRIEERRKRLPPFDRAIQELQALEANELNDQEAYKQYYSSLTAIVRSYLEEEANVNALESTTTELIQKLELLRTAGSLVLQPETISNLKKVLETADLVKFAKAAPGVGLASSDRSAIESVVVQTNEAIPEPTEEERLQNEVYRQELQKQRNRKHDPQSWAVGFWIVGRQTSKEAFQTICHVLTCRLPMHITSHRAIWKEMP